MSPGLPRSKGLDTDLIVAVATPPGQGGIGVIRMSGGGALQVLQALTGHHPTTRALQPRLATLCRFYEPNVQSENQQTYDQPATALIDEGLALWFVDGQSFTGEEVVELQVHGSPVVLQQLLNACCSLGARLARAGEFTERAFLNGKLDLAQAEAVADLIASASVAAARGAVRSLRGDFSRQIDDVAEDLATLRVLVEACIDFPEEEVESLENAGVDGRVSDLLARIQRLVAQCSQGRLMNEGASVALLGAPNVGKSSLLNVLAGEEAAIVTDIPGTTRDLLKVDLIIHGLPIRLVDTAGLRPTDDIVEQLGVARAHDQAQQADLVMLMFAVNDLPGSAALAGEWIAGEVARVREETQIPLPTPILAVLNKVDLLDAAALAEVTAAATINSISVTQDIGVEKLKTSLLNSLGRNHDEVPYTARARHVAALSAATEHLQVALQHLHALAPSELIAEELRAAHLLLGEIVGVVSADDLLGRIFSEFCIGK